MHPIFLSMIAIAGTASAGAFYVLTDDNGNGLAGSNSVNDLFQIYASDDNAYCDDSNVAPDGYCGVDGTPQGASCSADWAGRTWTAHFDSYDSGFGVATGSIVQTDGPTFDLSTDPRCEPYSCTYGGAFAVDAYKGFRCIIDV